jgi:hypothetical protein
MTAYKDHPLAALLPLLTQPELHELADDIREHGLLAPVTLFEGKVLDGRNRYRACKLAGVEPKFREFKGKDPLAFVLSANVHRRHLTESQRAMIAARVATMKEGRPSKTKTASREAVSQTEAAGQLDVSRASVQRAAEVLREGSPEEVGAVERGEKTVAEVSRAVKERKAAVAEVLDKTGHPVPAGILPDWRHAETFQPLLTDISRIKVAVERGIREQDLAFREVSNTLVAELASAYAQLKQLLPYAVCPTCQGHARDRCRLCKGRGYVSEFAWRQYVPEETKEIRRRARA